MHGSDQHSGLKAVQHLDQFEQQRQHPEGADVHSPISSVSMKCWHVVATGDP